MLKSMKNSPFKKINEASLQRKNFPVLEIFISIFLEELEDVVKK
jgi:5-methylcytosine-specific restriction enzyme subunit McrC